MLTLKKQGIPVVGKISEPSEKFGTLVLCGELRQMKTLKGKIARALPPFKVGSYFPWVSYRDEELSFSFVSSWRR